MAADFLAGSPPRPATHVPGLWVLDAPPIIHVRVYTADALLPQLDPPAVTHPDVLLERLRSDPLERAWYALNKPEPTTPLLLRPTCVVRPATPESQRELWVFSSTEGLVIDTDIPLTGSLVYVWC